MQRRSWRTLATVRTVLTCAVCSIALVALFSFFKVPNFSDPVMPPSLDDTSQILDDKLWNIPPSPDFVQYIEQVPTIRICDMVSVARIISATLVIPELDQRSFWKDSGNFSTVFDQDHFINALANDVKIVRKLPKELASGPRARKLFRSWGGMDYYQDEIASLWELYKVIRASKADARLVNSNLPPDIQKLSRRACYEALRFTPKIEAMGKLLVDRMRSFGPYIALHLRFAKDMLAFSADELRIIRALGYPPNTPIYIAAGKIYGDSRMADLLSRFPILKSKLKVIYLLYLHTPDTWLAAVEGHRRFLGHRKTVSPDRKALVSLFDQLEQGTLEEGKTLSNRVVQMHRKRQGSPPKRRGPLPGLRGKDKLRSEEPFYKNPLPDCLCRKDPVQCKELANHLIYFKMTKWVL